MRFHTFRETKALPSLAHSMKLNPLAHSYVIPADRQSSIQISIPMTSDQSF